MLVCPTVQARAHAELDEVEGRSRPPTFAEVPFLPYIRAMAKETLPWSPVAPFGLPHASTVDDWYEGMFIPKGTIYLQNMRVLNSDPEVFGRNAAEFDPTKYLDEKGQVKTLMEGREEGHMSFGSGRRCVSWAARRGRDARNRLCDSTLGDAIRASWRFVG